MKIINLNEEQASLIDDRLAEYDENYNKFKLEGSVDIGIEEDGKLVAGLLARVTAFRILYVNTVFVDEEYRGRGFGRILINETERRAVKLGANLIRLDTFNYQGKEFYEALGYECVGSYDNETDGYSEYFFLKRLG